MYGADTGGAGVSAVEGEFCIINWENYPSAIPRPSPPFKLLEGEEYAVARKAANNANTALHKADPSLAGKQIHEIKPVKFGGSPTDPSNKIALSLQEHAKLTTWWNRLLRELTGK
ncbi:MAG: hypothetical protein Fur006_34290 [Coleofasciculaceae cyanobacterium]